MNGAGVQSFLEGEDGQAKDYFKAAIKEAKSSGEPDVKLSSSLSGLAQLYYMQKKYDKAETLYKESLKIDEQIYGHDSPEVASKICPLVATYRHLGRDDQAEPLLLRALAIREKALGPDNPLVGNTLLDLSTLYSREGKNDKAEKLCKRALAIKEKTLGGTNLRLVPPLQIYADILRRLSREADAQEAENRAHDIESQNKK